MDIKIENQRNGFGDAIFRASLPDQAEPEVHVGEYFLTEKETHEVVCIVSHMLSKEQAALMLEKIIIEMSKMEGGKLIADTERTPCV